MSFLGHPVCSLGPNWCILLGLFIVFLALAIMFVLYIASFGKTKMANNVFKNQILQNIGLKMALRVFTWDFGDIIWYIFVFCLQNVFICYNC